MTVRRTSRLDRGTRSVLGSAGAAKRRANWFDMLLKSNIDQNEDHLLGLSTAAVAKNIKRTHQAGQANRSRSLKEAVLEESQLSNGGCIEDMIPDRWSKKIHLYQIDALNDIHDWDDTRKDFFKAEMSNRSSHKIDFINAILLFIRRIIIQNRVEDVQLGVESYKCTLNLTKTKFYFQGINKKIPYTTLGTEKGVVYLNMHNINSLMKLDEVHKFCEVSVMKVLKLIEEKPPEKEEG
ncbi:hypothetical protein Tco_1439619 [Tanacetum coccineum]